ncbi:MAG: hypothetical protein LAT68_04615 [Cyclobacteriaceae bacterium]|nr:hypothetical protein [Cyclobacteriaceae bacterium]MCH8515593.1 hypothetical protein [Cyclobacteriaceae bacterium]
MKKTFLLSILGGALALFSCSEKESINEDITEELVYFDIKSTIFSEINRLEQLDQLIEKTNRIQEELSKNEIQSSEIKWDKEFQIILELDINKSAYRDLYEIDTTKLDNGDYLVSYTATEEKYTQVPSLKLVFHQEDWTLKQLQGRFLERNYLYLVDRNIYVKFTPKDGKSLFEAYQISGIQKLWFFKELEFENTLVVQSESK